MKGAEKAIIKKDMRDVTSNRRLFSQLWIVPLMLTVVLPSIFICAAHFAPDDPEVLALLELLPGAASQGAWSWRSRALSSTISSRRFF